MKKKIVIITLLSILRGILHGTYLNPNRRFMRAGFYSLRLAGFNLGESISPWLVALLLLLAGFLFWLDSRQK